MNAYSPGSIEDRQMIGSFPHEKLLDYLFLQIRNLWRIDGLYFLEIEKRFGTEAATEIDVGVWEAMAGIEAKNLQKMFNIGENPGVSVTVELLRKTSWALDQPFKTIKTDRRTTVLGVDRCRTQEARLSKGLSEFPCKKVRYGYLKTFATTLNPKIKVKCLMCPPSKHPKDSWCKWEFTL